MKKDLEVARNREFPYASGYTARDSDDHEPGPEINWQESGVLVYSDPDRGIAGYQRIGAFRNRKKGDIYSWSLVDGRSVSRAKLTDLPNPGPINDTTLEGVTFATIEPLQKRRVMVDRDGVVADLIFDSYTGPIAWPLDREGVLLAKGHYECMGRVTGTVAYAGQVHDVDGVGYIDHSWGPRDNSTVHSCRWMIAGIDQDNHVNVWPLVANGVSLNGFLMLGGKLGHVTGIESELRVGSDQYHLNGASYKITDELDRTIELIAESVGEHSVQPFGQGLFAVHQPAVFQGMGKRWIGIIEWTPPRSLPPWELAAMKMSPDNEWLRIIPGG